MFKDIISIEIYTITNKYLKKSKKKDPVDILTSKMNIKSIDYSFYMIQSKKQEILLVQNSVLFEA